MAGVPHRCSHCETRHTFARRWDTYLRAKRCRSCKGQRFYVDTWMQKRKTDYRRLHKCQCDGYHFPHRKGSYWCIHYAGSWAGRAEAPRQMTRG